MRSGAAVLLLSSAILVGGTAHAAIVKVQDVGVGTTAVSSPLVITVPAAGVAAGDTILISVACSAPLPLTATDSKGNGYVVDATFSLPSLEVAIVRGAIGTALTSSDTILVLSAGVTDMVASATEFSGLVFPPVDAVASGMGPGGTLSTGPAATAQPSELLFGAFATTSFVPLGFTPGSLYASLASASMSIASGEILATYPEFRLVSSMGFYDADCTVTAPPIDWLAALVTYKDVDFPVELQSFSAE